MVDTVWTIGQIDDEVWALIRSEDPGCKETFESPHAAIANAVAMAKDRRLEVRIELDEGGSIWVRGKPED